MILNKMIFNIMMFLYCDMVVSPNCGGLLLDPQSHSNPWLTSLHEHDSQLGHGVCEVV